MRQVFADAPQLEGPPSRLDPSIHTWQAHDARVYDLAFSADGRQLVSVAANGELKMWPLRTIADPPQGMADVRDFVRVPHSDWLATVELESGLRLWNLRTQESRLLTTERGFLLLTQPSRVAAGPPFASESA